MQSIRGTVTDVGGGAVTVLADRETMEYPVAGEEVKMTKPEVRPPLATKGVDHESPWQEITRLKLQCAVLEAKCELALDLLRQAMGMRI